MDSSVVTRVAPAVALMAAVAAMPSMSWAGGRGSGGAVFRTGGGVHAGLGGFRGATGGSPRFGGFRGLPPVSGVIHEPVGMRPFYSAYGHTATALKFRGFARAGFGGYDHVDTGERPVGGAGRRDIRLWRGFPFRERLRFGARRGYSGSGSGGFGAGYGDGAAGYGGYADAGTYGGTGTYGASGSYGAAGTYGGSGTYGGGGTYGGDYASEEPLAARFAEPPLAPSPGAPYGPDDRYAYAASADAGPGPRIIAVQDRPRQDCGCGPRVQPIVYRYGVGTAY